jgi:hypothetical protein
VGACLPASTRRCSRGRAILSRGAPRAPRARRPSQRRAPPQVTLDLRISLPQVAVVGSQSSGKSSVLEALVSAALAGQGCSTPARVACVAGTAAGAAQQHGRRMAGSVGPAGGRCSRGRHCRLPAAARRCPGLSSTLLPSSPWPCTCSTCALTYASRPALCRDACSEQHEQQGPSSQSEPKQLKQAEQQSSSRTAAPAALGGTPPSTAPAAAGGARLPPPRPRDLHPQAAGAAAGQGAAGHGRWVRARWPLPPLLAGARPLGSAGARLPPPQQSSCCRCCCRRSAGAGATAAALQRAGGCPSQRCPVQPSSGGSGAEAEAKRCRLQRLCRSGAGRASRGAGGG